MWTATAPYPGNTFTSENLGALDGISYAGSGASGFRFSVQHGGRAGAVFSAGADLRGRWHHRSVVPFQYGEGIESLPEIPAKKGYSAAWPDLDYTHLNASQTLEAEYTPYTSALSGRWGTAGDPCGR